MRQLTRTLLTLFAAVLALWLVVGFWPISTISRSVLSVCILLVCGAALWHRWRRRQFVIPVTEHVLPPEDFQGAVVLVCGDTTSLFPPDTVYRETRQGWYIHAQNAEQLPLLAQHLAAVRPALMSQVSVLLALIPEQQTSEEALAQTLRSWRRSITQCRTWLNGVPPVWSVAWVSPPDLHPKEEAQWFTVTPELPGVRVRQNGHVTLPVTDWQWESGSRASRLYDTLWLDSILALMAHHLTRPLSARQGELPQLKLCAAGICLTPIAATEDNLWQQQIAGITTLCPKPDFAPELLPLPEVLLPYLPRRHGISRRMQNMRLAGGSALSSLRWQCWLPLSTTSGWCAAWATTLPYTTVSAARHLSRSSRRSCVCGQTAACWTTGCGVASHCVTGSACIRACV